MKRKGMEYILMIEAAACIIFCLLQTNFSGIFSGLAAFPFEQTGYMLRYLSLSGMPGNVTAIVLYILLSLIPCMLWFAWRRRGRLRRADYALPGLSILLFAVNYYMVNPGLFETSIPGTGKWILGCTFYSALSGYLVIRVLEVYREAEPEKLQDGLRDLLWFLNVVLVYLIFGQDLGSLLESLKNVQGSSTGIPMDGFLAGPQEPGMTYLFLWLRYFVNILPYLFDLVIVFLSIRLLTALKEDRYGDEAVNLADRLAGFCRKALGITVASDVALNLLQLLFRNRLYQIDIVVHVPVISIIFVLAVLLLTRYVHEDQKLKQDNDLFI